MGATTCEGCGKRPSTEVTGIGRRLCAQCFRELTGLSGAAIALGRGGTEGQAIATGVAAQAFTDAVRADRDHQARQRRKLAATSGFWRRLWVRIVG